MFVLSSQKAHSYWKRRNDSDRPFKAYKWFKKARYDGRDLKIPYEKDKIKSIGWHMYMTPEQALVGINKLSKFKDKNKTLGSSKLISLWTKFRITI